MQHRQINIFLMILLSSAIVFMSVNLIRLYRNSAYLPEETVDSIVSVLARDNIRISPSIIPTKLERGTVYVCSSEDYSKTVAQLLGNSKAKAEYIIPDGSILILENGARVSFGNNFSFRFSLDGSPQSVYDTSSVFENAAEPDTKTRENIAKIVMDFLDSGSRQFDTSNMSIVTVVESVAEKDGVYYALCTRTIDGVAMTANRVICTIVDSAVREAEGSWSFLTLGQSYSAQLSDLFNILFSVRKEIAAANENISSAVTIESIDLCYSMYYYGDKEDFCLIPCWQIATDLCGNFIYNALDSTLYTIN